MESLTGPDDQPEKTKPHSSVAKGPDRVTLGKLEGDKVEKWLAQVNQSSRGFLSLTKSDLVNFLIRGYRDELLTKELQKIRSDHYDPIRHIQWLTPQLKIALGANDVARIAELQSELRKIELSFVRDAMSKVNAMPIEKALPKKRKSKQKSDLKPTQDEVKYTPRFEEIQSEIPDA